MAGRRFRKPCVILNPKAASGRALRRWPLLRPLFEESLGATEALFTEAPGHAIDLSRDALRGGADLIVACGGDGTLSEVVNGYLSAGPDSAAAAALGLCPFGTGGDFRRSAGIPRRPREAIGAMASRQTRLVDACRLRLRGHSGSTVERFCINTASFGMGGEVATAAKRSFLSSVSGKGAFLWATGLSFLRYRAKQVQLKVGERPEQAVRIMQVALGNGTYQGGGMAICPKARLDSGRMEITVVEEVGLLTFLMSLRLLYAGTVYTHPKCHHFRARRVAATSQTKVAIEVDGEAIGTLPLEAEVLPGAVKMAGLDIAATDRPNVSHSGGP
ncbi:MAG: diacylglycerol kinase family lipid kinase [Bryobacterales bacterium]|nr:diacylglycerol kinase family lipid kinase [Bryobacterales bacterium]